MIFTLKKARSRWYSTETTTDADYADDIVLLTNTPTQARPLLLSLEYMCFNQKRDFSLNSGSLKLEDKFMYLRSNISSTEKDINMQLAKAWTAIDWLSVIWKSELSDKIKYNFFQAAVESILLYGCTTWMLTKHIEKKLDRNCKRMLWAIRNKSWK